MAINKRPGGKKSSKPKRKRGLDAEDRVAVIEKKALKKQKSLEHAVQVQEARKRRQAIKAAGTIQMEDVIKAISSKGDRKTDESKKALPEVNALLSGLGVSVGDFGWSSDEASEVSDDDLDASASEVGSASVYSDGDESDAGDDEFDDEFDDEEQASGVEDSGDDAVDESASDLHERISFPAGSEFTSESQRLFAALSSGDDVVFWSQAFHESRVARSVYLSVSAFALSHMLHQSTRVEKNNKRLRKRPDLECRDQGPNRARICVLAPFRANAFEIVRNWIALLDLQPDAVGNYENFAAEFEGQDSRNESARNWEDWRRELFKGHYDDSNYDDFVIGISFNHGKLRLQFPKTAQALCNVDVVIASPLALSRIAASDFKTLRVKEKFAHQTEVMEGEPSPESPEEEDETPVMDFLSGIELLIVDRIDALAMQNFENARDVVRAVNAQAVATISADINRIEEKFLSPHSARAARQTVLIAGSVMRDDYIAGLGLREDKVSVEGDACSTGTALHRALKQKIKQQFFIRLPVAKAEERSEALLAYFKSTFWSEIGNDIKYLVIVVAETADLPALKECLDDEGVVDCFLSELDLSDIGGKRRKQMKAVLRGFREGDLRTIVVTERLLWYQRIRISAGKHVLFYGCPKTDSVYADILADIEDPLRCTSTCIYTANERTALERIVGSANIDKLVTPGAELHDMAGKSTVFTPN